MIKKLISIVKDILYSTLGSDDPAYNFVTEMEKRIEKKKKNEAITRY